MFDPFMLNMVKQLCEGGASVGDVGLPYINFTTPIEFGQTVSLSEDESAALYRSIRGLRPPVIALNLDIIGNVVLPFVMGMNAFIGSVLLGGEYIIININSTSEYLPNYDGYYWEVTASGGTLNPIE